MMTLSEMLNMDLTQRVVIDTATGITIAVTARWR